MFRNSQLMGSVGVFNCSTSSMFKKNCIGTGNIVQPWLMYKPTGTTTDTPHKIFTFLLHYFQSLKKFISSAQNPCCPSIHLTCHSNPNQPYKNFCTWSISPSFDADEGGKRKLSYPKTRDKNRKVLWDRNWKLNYAFFRYNIFCCNPQSTICNTIAFQIFSKTILDCSISFLNSFPVSAVSNCFPLGVAICLVKTKNTFT